MITFNEGVFSGSKIRVKRKVSPIDFWDLRFALFEGQVSGCYSKMAIKDSGLNCQMPKINISPHAVV